MLSGRQAFEGNRAVGSFIDEAKLHFNALQRTAGFCISCVFACCLALLEPGPLRLTQALRISEWQPCHEFPVIRIEPLILAMVFGADAIMHLDRRIAMLVHALIEGLRQRCPLAKRR